MVEPEPFQREEIRVERRSYASAAAESYALDAQNRFSFARFWEMLSPLFGGD
jgi:hypothetical protein